jgi:hypothetical protein
MIQLLYQLLKFNASLYKAGFEAIKVYSISLIIYETHKLTS